MATMVLNLTSITDKHLEFSLVYGIESNTIQNLTWNQRRKKLKKKRKDKERKEKKRYHNLGNIFRTLYSKCI